MGGIRITRPLALSIFLLSTSPLTIPAHGESLESLIIRGKELDTPFRIRILMKSFESGEVEIAGNEVRDERHRLVGDAPLRCAPQRRFEAAPRRPGERAEAAREALQWSCLGQNYRRVLTGPSRFEPSAGFVQVNGEFYRGAVDLVPVGERLLLINEVELSYYLAGLVNKEMRADYPHEALKAQIVAARSYALATAADRRRAGSPFDLHSTEADQVYAGTGSENAQAHRLVREVRNEVLFHREEVLKAYYHSSSGGRSEVPSNVWGLGRDERAYVSRASPVDEKLAVDWSVVLSPNMGLRWREIGRIRSVRVVERSNGFRVKRVEVAGEHGTRVWTGAELRARLGPRWLKSTAFTVERVGQGWQLKGRGWGHGVGLSQLGAREMARQGKSYRQILDFYYPFSNVRRLDVEPSPDLTAPVMAEAPRKTPKSALSAR